MGPVRDRQGAVRHWIEPGSIGRTALCSEVRVRRSAFRAGSGWPPCARWSARSSSSSGSEGIAAAVTSGRARLAARDCQQLCAERNLCTPVALDVGLMSLAVSAFDSHVTIRHRRYASEESGWAVIDAAADDGLPVVLVGPLIHLEEHERAHVIGTWVDDSRYGKQVKVSEARPLPPTDVESVTTYLRRVKHVGGKRAAKLIERYGAARCSTRSTTIRMRAFAARGAAPRTRSPRRRASWERMRALAAAASAAGAARPRVSGLADPGDLRGLRAPRRLRAPVRADQRVRGRLPHRRPDRARTGEPGGSTQRARAAALHVLVRGRAQRQHVPADRLAACGRSRSCSDRRPSPS